MADEIDDVVYQRIKRALEEDVKYQQGEAKDYPREFAKALKDFLEEQLKRIQEHEEKDNPQQ